MLKVFNFVKSFPKLKIYKILFMQKLHRWGKFYTFAMFWRFHSQYAAYTP